MTMRWRTTNQEMFIMTMQAPSTIWVMGTFVMTLLVQPETISCFSCSQIDKSSMRKHIFSAWYYVMLLSSFSPFAFFSFQSLYQSFVWFVDCFVLLLRIHFLLISIVIVSALCFSFQYEWKLKYACCIGASVTQRRKLFSLSAFPLKSVLQVDMILSVNDVIKSFSLLASVRCFGGIFSIWNL